MRYDAIKRLFEESFGDQIQSITILILQNRLKIDFTSKSVLFIIYNKVGEYSYQLMFSNSNLDRVRFDSMDKKWEVSSKPNHFHPRFTKEAFNSPMTGEYAKDIPYLIKLIQSNELLDRSWRYNQS